MEDVEVSGFGLLVLITRVSQRRKKLNPSDFLTSCDTKHTVHLVGSTWYFAKSGPWIYATQYSLSACDLTFQIFPSLVFMNTLFYEICLTSQLFPWYFCSLLGTGFQQELSISVSLNYHSFLPSHLDIYISSLAFFPSSAYFQAPCLLLLRSCHTLSRSWQSDIQYLCLLATSRADVFNLQVKSSHPHLNWHPSLRFAVCLCFCSNNSRSNKGSAFFPYASDGITQMDLMAGYVLSIALHVSRAAEHLSCS